MKVRRGTSVGGIGDNLQAPFMDRLSEELIEVRLEEWGFTRCYGLAFGFVLFVDGYEVSKRMVG